MWDVATDENLNRITKTSVGRKIQRVSLLEKKADKLPETMNYISQVEESLEAFQIRRVEFIIEKLKKEGEPIIEWDIYRKAGLRSTVSNEVKRFITLKVTQYDSDPNIKKTS